MACSNKKVHDEITFNWLESELSRGQITIEATSIAHIMKDLVDWRDKKMSNTSHLLESGILGLLQEILQRLDLNKHKWVNLLQLSLILIPSS